MKELTIEQKAKAYDEALKRAIAAHKDKDRHLKATLERIFPELKESEDEKIRKVLKHYLEVRRCQTQSDEEYINCNNFLAWLEKQGTSYTKKDVDDAFVEGMALAKKELEKQGEQPKEAAYTHEVETGNGNIKALVTEKVQLPKFKVGDWVVYNYPDTISPISQIISIQYNIVDLKDTRGVVFQTEIDDLETNYHSAFSQDVEQKSAWSEEDEKMLNSIIEDFGDGKTSNMLQEYWLKSIKDRVQPQPKQEWSEEDEVLLSSIINTLEMIEGSGASKMKIDFLKSLKERYIWKPSEEQVHAFEQVYDWYNNNFAPSETLTSLYKDLEKLKGE